MKDESKTKKQLIEELEALQKQVDKLKKTETRAKQAGKPSLAAQYWQTMFDAINDAVSIIDGNGKITQCNKAMASLLQKPMSEIIGHKCWELMHGSTKPIPECPIVRMKKSLKRETLTLPLMGRWFEVTADPIVNKRGKLAGAVHIIVDITEHKRAEEMLQKSELKYRQLIEQAPDTIFIVDGEGNLLNVNLAGQKMLGYSEDEFCKMTTVDTYPLDEMAVARRRLMEMRAMRAGETMHFERQMRRKNGTLFPVEISVGALKDGTTHAIIRDITERKQAEKVLREEREFSDSLIASMQEGFSVLDSHGVHINVNPALCQMTGFSREELIGTGPPHLYWPPEAYEEIDSAFQKTLRGELGSFELTFMRKNDERFPVIVSPSHIKDKQGNIINYFATFKDITERKRAEEEVAHQHAFLRQVIDSNPNLIFVKDRNDRYLLANRATVETFGTSAEYMLGKTDIELGVLPEEFAKYRQDDIDVLQSGKAKLIPEECYTWPSGEVHYYETTKHPQLDEKGITIGVLALCVDITERKQAEKALKDSEERYRLLFNNVSDAVFVHEVAPDASDPSRFRFIEVNDNACRYLGYSREELLQMSVLQIDAPETLENIPALLNKLFAEGRVTWEGIHIHKDGHRIPVEISIQIFKLFGRPLVLSSARDITERKRIEEALTNSERKYRILVENIPQKIFYKDRNSVYVSCNQNYARDLGIKLEEIAGKTDYEFYPKEIAEKYRADDKRIIEKGQIEEIEERYIHGGQDRVVQTFKVPVRDEKGNVMGVFAIFQDITERKKAEEELRANQEKLRLLASQMSLIEEQERRRIAIELHDSIGQSLALAKLKLEGMRSLDPFSYLVEPIDELLDIMNQTISQTRSLTSEISPPVLYELGLEPAIRWLGERLLKQKGIIFEFISDGQPKPLTDDIRIILFQSVRELLVNILKHSHAKSVIVSIKRDGDYLQFTIEDDGIGFDTSRIVSTESFGIFNIRERIKLIGGSIEIQSEPGKGTQITIRVSLKR